jgi:hypothetical protein
MWQRSQAGQEKNPNYYTDCPREEKEMVAR